MALQPGVPPLRGARVLLLEDEPILLIAFQDDLLEMGCASVTCFNRLGDAVAALETDVFDVAVLDIHLGNEQTSFELAALLSERGVPFVFATGSMGEENPPEFQHIALVSKPFASGALEQALVDALARSFG